MKNLIFALIFLAGLFIALLPLIFGTWWLLAEPVGAGLMFIGAFPVAWAVHNWRRYE